MDSPAIGSTINTVPSGANVSCARLAAPIGSPKSWRQSKNAIRSYVARAGNAVAPCDLEYHAVRHARLMGGAVGSVD